MRLIIRVISAVVIALALMLGAMLLLPGEKVAQIAADQVQRQTGRELVFSGPVRFTFWPTLGMKADGVTLSNAKWSGPQPLFRAERVTIGLAAADLIRGDVRITEISAILPELNLATREDGTGNWVFDGQTAPQADGPATGESLPVAVEALSLTGASLNYAAHGAAPVQMKQIDLQIDWPNPNGTAQVDLTVRPAGEPIRIRGEIGTFSKFLSGAVASVGMTVEAPGARVRFDGNADLAGDAKGRLTANASDPGLVLAALGQAGSWPDTLTDPVVVAGDLTYTSDGRLAVRDLDLSLGENRATGAADLDFSGPVPNVQAKLSAKSLDVPQVLSPSSASGAGSEVAGWSKAAIDASALGVMNGKIGLTFEQLTAGDLVMGASSLVVSVDRARAVFDMSPAAVFGGTIQGQLVANNRNGLSVGGSLSFDNIELQKALGQTADFDRLNGTMLGEVTFLGVGNSQDAIMRSLSGKGWIEIGKGFFTGFDLEALMRSGGGNGGSTVFDQLSGSYTLDQGVLSNSDLLMKIKGLDVTGAGQVLIGAQALDYLFKPTLAGVNKGSDLTIPVKVTGPWSDPKFRPDLKGALKPRLQEVETRAKDKLREKLSQELEADITPEQDLNEVLKDRIEQEAKDQLLKLLGGN